MSQKKEAKGELRKRKEAIEQRGKNVRHSLIVRNAIIALVISLISGLLFFTKDIQVNTMRNGEEHCDTFLNGQVFTQELILEHTPKLYVSCLPAYISPNSGMGVRYTLQTKNQKQTGFILLSDCSNKEWTSLIINNKNLSYVGKSVLTLEAVGLNESNSLQFLIATNTLQKNPDCHLQKNGTIISNGRMCISYKALKLSTLPAVIFATFFIALGIVFLIPKILNIGRKYPLIYAVAVLFVANIIAQYPSFKNINLQVSAQYLFSWQNLGFVRRALAGTLLELFHVDFTVKKYVLYGVFCIALMLALELCILYDRKHITYRNSMQKCFLLFLCSPFAVTLFFGYHFLARFDEVLIIFFLLSCIIIIKERGVFLIPVFSALAVLTHEMYVAMFIPFVFCLLLYKWYLTKQKKYFASLVTSSVVSVGLGLYLGFFAKTATSYNDAWHHIQANGNPAFVWDYLLHVDYYMDSHSVISDCWGVVFQNNTIPIAVFSMLLLLPLILLAIFWLRKYFTLQRKKLARLIILLFPCTLAGLAISMYTMCDWGRLFVMYGVGVFFTFLTLWSIDSKNVNDSAADIWHQACAKCGNWLFPGMCVFYLFASTYGGGASSTSLFEFIRTLF
ncbi:MAG TPA: hypothetical protein VHP31_09470 [Caproicibacter sp.]|nr:hypothetical protein [Caproicibacter sp.]